MRYNIVITQRRERMKQNFVCCFTGHRNIDAECTERLSEILDGAIDKLIDAGVTTFRSGGAVGFDTFAALKIIEKKRTVPNVRLEFYLPCRDQSSRWDDYSKEAYEYILKHADNIVYTSEKYSRGCMLERDRKMVDGCDFCIGYCTKTSGGTAYTLEYAKKSGVRTLNIAAMI